MSGLARAAFAALALACASAGCGATPPQAPSAQANRVAAALEGISEACGEAAQQHALPRLAAPTLAPERAALTRALELAHVLVRNPDWIYQGDTLRQVVALADARLRECGLASAAAALRRWTAAS